MPEKILLVEDDRLVRRATALALADEGYDVLEAGDADEGLRAMRDRRPDLVILDVMLPGERDGFEAAREIRRSSDVPIIFLTAKTDTVDVVVGLESGGDDYLTKPFAPRELIARIRALLRRRRAEPRAEKTVVEDLEIDIAGGVVRKAGEPVGLTKTEFNLLRCLVERANQLLSREMLLELVWGYDYLGDSRLVDVHVRRLRAKIESDPSEPKVVLTIRGLGYKFSTEP
ncbi:MAG TPA: response regulator transcription factor [Actinomycetota bacterium]